MKRLSATCIILATVACCLAQNKFASLRLASGDGLPTNAVSSIVQDRDGYMWFATTCGLSRYDGYIFHNYNILSSNPHQQNYLNVQALSCDDKNGLLWVYNAQHAMRCYDLETAQFVDYTGKGDDNKPYYHRQQTSRAMVLYDDRNGVRRITKEDGHLTTTDYTVDNGLLPRGSILSLHEDKSADLWIATECGIMRIDSSGKSQQLALRDSLLCCCIDGRLLYTLSRHGRMTCYDSSLKPVRLFRQPALPVRPKRVRQSIVWNGQWLLFAENYTLAIDLKTGKCSRPADCQMQDGTLCAEIDGEYYVSNHQGTLFIFARDGLHRLPLISSRALDPNRYRHFSAVRDKHGRIFVAAYGSGLYTLNDSKEITARYSRHDAQPLITSDLLTCVATDRSGSLWVGSRNGIFKMSEQMQIQATYVLPVPESSNQMENSLRCVASDAGQLVISTSDGWMMQYDGSRLHRTGNKPLNVKCMMRDRDNRIWLGTRGDGLIVDGVAYNNKQDTHHLPASSVLDLCQDRRGRVWIATWNDGLLMTEDLQEFTQMLGTDYGQRQVAMLQIDAEERLWIATADGLHMIDTRLPHPKPDDIRRFCRQDGSLPFDETTCLTAASDSSLWVGSNAGLALARYDGKKQQLRYTLITTREGLPSGNIHSVVEDQYGKIWVGTEDGLARIDPSRQATRSFILSDIHEQNAFADGHPARMDDGRIALATTGGLLIITPYQDQPNEMPQERVLITDLYINGQSLYDLEEDLTKGKSLSKAGTIRLNHEQNSITFCFSDFNYSHMSSRMFRYRLDGVDRQWQQVTSRHYAIYSGLNPGKYRFVVEAQDGTGSWTQSQVLSVSIAQPWWNTWWAWTIYLSAAALAALLVFRVQRRHYLLRQELKVNKMMTNFKMDFFTNMAHELRTPVSLMLASAEDVMQNPKSRMAQQTLRRGAARMQRLISGLMEFRKVNTGHAQLQVARGDIIQLLQSIEQDFFAAAKQKGITMVMTPHAKEMMLTFDRNRVEMIVHNLLSNAVKYTPEKGDIAIRTRLSADDRLLIDVENSGRGLNPEQEKALFQPFMNGQVAAGGIGIGLYLARLLAGLHHGSLTYRRPEGSDGCIFTLALPTADDVYTDEEHLSAMQQQETGTDTEGMIGEMIRPMNDRKAVIVEDDLDMLQQMRQTLAQYLKVVCVSDGSQAMATIMAEQPDIVVSDIMLPGKNGLEIVSEMRAIEQTRHTPIILLTALDDDHSRLKAIQNGADDYIVKPCHPAVLVARTLQLIERAQHENTETTEKPAASPLIRSEQDRRMADRLNSMIEAHLSDPEFNVDRMAELLGSSRTKTFYKIKSLTGMTPNAYLLNLRLERAAEMLSSSDKTINEISDATGFSSASYFTTCFKQRYGVAPTRYRSAPTT